MSRSDTITRPKLGPGRPKVCWVGGSRGLPARDTKKLHWAPNDVMLELLSELEARPDQSDFRYVPLAAARAAARAATGRNGEPAGQQRGICVVFARASEVTYRVTTEDPNPERVREIQQSLADLLVGGTS